MTSLLVGFGIVLTTLITTLYLSNKKAKGILLSKLETIALVVGIITDLLFLVSLIVPNIPIIPEAISASSLQARWVIIFFLVVIGLVFGYLLITRKRKVLDPRFNDLHVFYSQSTDTPDTPAPSHPSFILNIITRQAYWIPKNIESYIREWKMVWDPFPGETALRDYFTRQGITPHDDYATLDQLGLKMFFSDLFPYKRTLDSALLSKLKKSHKIKDFQLAFLNPPLKKRGIPSKRLLLECSTRNAFHPPMEDLEVWHSGGLASDNFTIWPWESLRWWCKWRRYHYRGPRRFSVEELLDESK